MHPQSTLQTQLLAHPHVVYALCDPDTRQVRYIGQTDSPNGRYRQHLSNARRPQSAKDHWIASLLAQGKRPTFHVLARTQREHIDMVERAIIQHLQSCGVKLTNRILNYPHHVEKAEAQRLAYEETLWQTWASLVRGHFYGAMLIEKHLREQLAAADERADTLMERAAAAEERTRALEGRRGLRRPRWLGGQG